MTLRGRAGAGDEEAARPRVTKASATDETTPLLAGPVSSPAVGCEPDQPESSCEASSCDEGEVEEEEEEQTVLAEEYSFVRLVFMLGPAYVGVFLGSIDSTIFATLSGPISSEFNSLSLLSWLATAYLIANAACQPISGRLTDIFGRGPGLVFSNVFFAAGNLICGLAQTGSVMILGRVVAGIGGGGLMSIATFLASDLVPLRKRGIVQGLGNIAYGSGSLLGGVVGGLINDRTTMGWRLAFLAQVPVALVSAVMVGTLVRVPPKISNKSLVSRIDFAGVFLTLSFLILLLLGLNAGGNLVPWSHPLVLTTIPLSVVALAGFIFWESRTPQPVIPVRLLLERTVAAACIVNLLCTMSLYMIYIYVPLYMQVLGNTAADAGLRLVGASVGLAISSVGSGIIMKRTGRYVRLGVASVLVYVVGLCIIFTLDEKSWSWTPMGALFVIGAGYGAMLTVTLLACIASVDHSHQAVITSATYAFRSIGSTLGVTVASAVYQNVLRERLWDRFGSLPGAADEISRIRDTLDELKHLPDGWGPGVLKSFMEAFRGVWATGLTLAVLAFGCVCLLKQHTLHSNLARK